MTGVLVHVAASGTATSTPAPTPPPAVDPNKVTPGLLGFLVVFVLALACYLLFRNLTGRLRRMRFREDERLANEAGPADQPDGGPAGPAGGSAPRR